MAKKKRFNYFDAFEEQIKIAEEESDVLIEAIESFATADDLEPLLKRAHVIEHRGDEVNTQILANVSIDFITPIERADIIELAQNIDDITDKIEGVLQRFYMFDIQLMEPQALEFARIIKKSLKALHKSMDKFREFKKVKKIQAMVEDVNALEEQADELYISTINSLYTVSSANAMRLEIWSRLFDRLEGAVDACKEAYDTMANIMLKNV